MRTEYDAGDVSRIVKELALRIAGDLPAGGALNVIGIRTRGEVVAERLAEVVNQTVENLFVEGCGAHVECRGHASV